VGNKYIIDTNRKKRELAPIHAKRIYIWRNKGIETPRLSLQSDNDSWQEESTPNTNKTIGASARKINTPAAVTWPRYLLKGGTFEISIAKFLGLL